LGIGGVAGAESEDGGEQGRELGAHGLSPRYARGTQDVNQSVASWELQLMTYAAISRFATGGANNCRADL
jgi:hypothetical protein